MLIKLLGHRDVFVRSSVASSLGDIPSSPEVTEALQKAFKDSLETDKDYNDAQLSILSVLTRLDKNAALPSINLALKHYDHLVRVEIGRKPADV